MQINSIDHIVLTVKNIEQTVRFYCDILGMTAETFAEERVALKFGTQKINLHQKGAEFKPNAQHADSGTADICFITATPLEDIVAELNIKGIKTETAIVQRTGSMGAIRSIYLRDPDGNLLELSNY